MRSITINMDKSLKLVTGSWNLWGFQTWSWLQVEEAAAKLVCEGLE